MCVHVHLQHAHFVLNPHHIEVSNMAASVDSTNHLVSKHLKSTHNCAPCGVCVCVCVSTTETWSKLIGIPSRCPGKAYATPSVGPGAEPTCYEQTKNLGHRKRQTVCKFKISVSHPGGVVGSERTLWQTTHMHKINRQGIGM